MDRRDFLKFMGVTAATTTASKVLANIPEAEPKIQLLEPKKIVTINSDIKIFEHIISYHLNQNENLMLFDNGSLDNFRRAPFPGRRVLNGEVTVYLDSHEEANDLMFGNNNIRKVMFNIPDLKDRLFVIGEAGVSASVGELITVVLQVIEIHN